MTLGEGDVIGLVSKATGVTPSYDGGEQRAVPYSPFLLGQCPMTKRLFLAPFLLCALSCPASADYNAEIGSGLLACEPLDAAVLEDDGTLHRNADFRFQDRAFTIDISTGAIRLKGQIKPVIWNLIQEGNSSYDFIFTPPLGQQIGALSSFVRIRTWSNSSPAPQIQFFWLQQTSVVTGFCKPLR
ncbi:MAG: hypothetical protein Q8M47_10510 [Devosia sp.]|nr:hypothetical protein [Devosia sp.]